MASACVIASRSLQPLRSWGWSANSYPPIVLLGEAVGLDHRAHGAVEDQHSLSKQGFQQGVCFGTVDYSHCTTPRGSRGDVSKALPTKSLRKTTPDYCKLP